MTDSGRMRAFWYTWFALGLSILAVLDGILYGLLAASCPSGTFLTGVAHSFSVTIALGVVFSWAMALVLCEWGFHRFLEPPGRSVPLGPMIAGRAQVSLRVAISSILA